jgi:ribosome maturation factor RimP
MTKDVAEIIDAALAALNFELVDVERVTRGLLRVYIDKPDGVSVEDCATASNHLSRVFAVEGIDYERLEVSSPGLDRPLKRLADFQRFAGKPAKVRLNTMVDNRKRFEGTIESVAGEQITFRLLADPDTVAGGKSAKRAAKNIKPVLSDKTINVGLADIERARLIPEI